MYKTIPKVREVTRGIKITEEDLNKYGEKFSSFKDLQTEINRVQITEVVTMIMAAAIKSNSSDIYFYSVGGGYGAIEGLGISKISHYLRKFLADSFLGIDLPGEQNGFVPDQNWKLTTKGESWYIGDTYHVAIGQGDILVTPLQVAAFTSVFANGGTLYELQYPRTPEEIVSLEPRVRTQLDDLAEYFPQVKQGLAATVLYGTGRQAYDPDAGWQVLGKTGSCSENGARLGWFVSYSAEPQPKYVVVVLLRGGRVVYGPTAAEIAGKIYHGLRTRELIPTQAEAPSPEFATILKSSF